MSEDTLSRWLSSHSPNMRSEIEKIRIEVDVDALLCKVRHALFFIGCRRANVNAYLT